MFQFFGCKACGNLGSLTRDRTHTPCIGRWSLNHWLPGKPLGDTILNLRHLPFSLSFCICAPFPGNLSQLLWKSNKTIKIAQVSMVPLKSINKMIKYLFPLAETTLLVPDRLVLFCFFFWDINWTSLWNASRTVKWTVTFEKQGCRHPANLGLGGKGIKIKKIMILF